MHPTAFHRTLKANKYSAFGLQEKVKVAEWLKKPLSHALIMPCVAN